MNIGQVINIGRFKWTVVNINKGQAFALSEPIKTCAEDVCNSKINMFTSYSIESAIIVKPIEQIVIKVSPICYDSPDFIDNKYFTSAKMVIANNKQMFFLPGICDIFHDIEFKPEILSNENFIRLCISGSISNIVDYFSIKPEGTTMLRDIQCCKIQNESEERIRPTLVFTEMLQSKFFGSLWLIDATGFNSQEYPEIYCGMDTVRWLQLCCYIDIQKYEALPTRIQITGIDF